MRLAHVLPALPLLVLAGIAACADATKQELTVANSARADSLTALRTELLDHVMEGTRFVNEINKELARARSLGPGKQLEPLAELTDVNEERKQVVARISQLVERLDLVQARLAGVRKQLADTDSTLKSRVVEYERMVAEVNLAAERQRIEFQAVIDSQATRIASLTQNVDTLTGQLARVTSQHHAAYYVVGTREELVKKGVLVPEGQRRFVLAGRRPVVPARELDPNVFTRIDSRVDSTILLPDGEYKIVSRHNGALAVTESVKKGRVAGSLRIGEPDRFWSSSRFLILVRG